MLRLLAFATLITLGAAIFAPARADAAPAAAAEKVRVILIDGQNNHNWRDTSPLFKKYLEDAGRFTVDISSFPKAGDKPNEAQTVAFPPDLGKYDVLLSNYNGAPWPDDFQKSVEQRINNGQLGLVIVHAANNPFAGWQEFNLMIGMGWRGKDFGERLKYDDSGKEVRVAKGGDEGSGHRYKGPFTIVLRDREHPITKGMPPEWLHANDELYDNMRGPIQNVHMLATAYSKGTKAHEPMIWTVSYGKGRVFHTPMGHVMGKDFVAIQCIGFIATLQRGTEWAATGKVTLPLPENFPTADKTSTLPK